VTTSALTPLRALLLEDNEDDALAFFFHQVFDEHQPNEGLAQADAVAQKGAAMRATGPPKTCWSAGKARESATSRTPRSWA